MTSLYLRFLRNDLRRNRGVTVTLLVVLVLGAFLMSSGALVMERLSGSVSRLFETAKPPHFLQMHKGDYDRAALERFAAGRPEIEAWQVEEMQGFDGQRMNWERPGTSERGDFSRSLIDNLFVTQNANFDFLLDQRDGAPHPAAGEVYVPVAYERQFGLRPGDRLTVDTGAGAVTLGIVGFVRDAQMASSMSSATRFLVSEPDFARLSEGGAAEIIVEYRFTDPAAVDEFQRAYEANADLPKNGQAVTEVMIRVVNMFSDGLVAVAFVFASLLLIAIALLNVRFVIRGTLEDEIHEIGAMKAIGLPNRTISRLYLLRYGAMALIACVLGGGLSMLALGVLTGGIQANLSTAPVTVTTVLAPVIALLAMFALVIGICARVLRTVRTMSVVGALVRGETAPEKPARRRSRAAGSAGRSALAGAHRGNVNGRLALLDLRHERGQWALIPAVFFLAAVLITLPANLLSTFESPRFVTYMGAPESDLRADVQFVSGEGETADGVHRRLLAGWAADDRIDRVRSYAGMLYETRGEEGWEALRVEVGDYTDSTLVFLSGQRPGADEIALSTLNAQKLGVEPGRRITVRHDGTERQLTVSGVYQDVTSGGFTAKMQGRIDSGADRWVLYADLVDGQDPVAVAAEYDAAHPAAAVVPMGDYVRQTLSYVTDALRTAAWLTLAFGLGSAALITTLFIRLRISKERRRLGVLAVLGFSISELIGQLRLKTALTVAGGTVLGVVFAATVGERLVGALIAATGLGVSQLSFIPSPLTVYVLYPLLLLAAGTIGAIVLTGRLRTADRSQWLR